MKAPFMPHGQTETPFDAADLYAEMTHNWREKSRRLQARRWDKVLKREKHLI